jgi:hypothetical protein
MRVRILVNTQLGSGEPIEAGEVVDVPDEVLWRFVGRYEPATDERPASREEIEERDPEPTHRDPKGRKAK